MGNGEWGMGNGEWGMGNGEWEWGMGNGNGEWEWGMGNGEWGMRNGECGMGNAEWGMRNGNAECGMRNAECGMKGMRNAECGMRNAERAGRRRSGGSLASRVFGLGERAVWRRFPCHTPIVSDLLPEPPRSVHLDFRIPHSAFPIAHLAPASHPHPDASPRQYRVFWAICVSAATASMVTLTSEARVNKPPRSVHLTFRIPHSLLRTSHPLPTRIRTLPHVSTECSGPYECKPLQGSWPVVAPPE